METVDLLLYPKWIIPIQPANQILEHHAIAIKDGLIHDVLTTDAAAKKYKANNHLKLEDHVVLPGLVNAHTHSPMTLFRGMADDLELMDWLNNHIWPAERKWMSPEFIQDGTELALLEMIRGGTTCFNENYFFSETIAETTANACMRACIGTTIIDFSSAYADSPEEYIQKAKALHLDWQTNPLITTSIAPQGPYTNNDDSFRKVLELAQEYDLIIHLHLHETDAEIQESLQKYKKRPLKRILDLGLISEKLQCIHMTQINDEDIDILKETKPQIIHCPESNLKLNSGFSPIGLFKSLHLNNAIGTDGAASNNDLDMFSEMRTAAILAKTVANNPRELNAMEALEMATINGAKALHLEDKIGTIAIGKQADIIAVDLNSASTQPVYNPISQLVYAANSRQVSHVWVAGKCLFQNGQHLTLDKSQILAKASTWQKRIRPNVST